MITCEILKQPKMVHEKFASIPSLIFSCDINLYLSLIYSWFIQELKKLDLIYDPSKFIYIYINLSLI